MESNRTAVLGALALAAMMGGVLMCLLWAKTRRATPSRRASATSPSPIPAPQPAEAPGPEPERAWQPVVPASQPGQAARAGAEGKHEEAVELDRDQLDSHIALVKESCAEIRGLMSEKDLSWSRAEPLLTRLMKRRRDLEGAVERRNFDPKTALTAEQTLTVREVPKDAKELRAKAIEAAKRPAPVGE